MFARIAAVLCLAILCCTGALAQGTVKGTVRDKMTGEALPGVYLLYADGKGTVTDDNGTYSITTAAGPVEIRYQLVGYQPQVRRFKIEDNKTITSDILLETDTRILDQIVVSADRTEHKISDLTVSVDVIKSDFLAKNHVTDAQELITKSSGIEVLDGQASVRGGSGYSYGVGSRVMALVDGLPLLSPDAGGIRWQYLPMENVSQVEIIKGASSVMYGSSALNGIINFRSSEAGNIPVTRFFTEAGLYLEPRREEWKWWSDPRIFSTTAFSHLRRVRNTDIGLSMNLFIDNSYRKYNDERLGKLSIRLKHRDKKIEGLNYGINLTGGLTDKTDFILWESADNALVQDTSSVSQLNGRFLAIDPFISYSGSGRLKHDLKMRIQSSENRYPVKTRNNAQSFSLYTEYLVRYRMNDYTDLTAGLSETWNRIRSNFFGDHDGLNLAAFLQAEVRPVERLKINGGIRFEQNILDSDPDRVVPVFRTGINYRAAPYTFLRASFGQGYRFPSVAEKYASTTLGSVSIFPNPYVKAESGWSTEAGIKQGLRFGNITGQADLALFFSQNTDMIEYVFGLYPQGTGFLAENVEFARIYGTELEFMLDRQFEKFTLTAAGGYTFVNPCEVNPFTNKNNGTWLKYRRKHSAKISVSAKWQRLNTEIGIYARSKILNIDDVFLNPATREEILPGFYDYWLENNRGYIIADLGAGYKAGRKALVSFSVKNAFNAEYMGRPGDIQTVRNISLRISFEF